MSRVIEPVGITCTSATSALDMRIIEPLPKSFSIFSITALSTFNLSGFACVFSAIWLNCFYFFVFRIRCPVRKLWIFPPAELCCSVVAARRLTDLPTRFLKVGIAVSLRVFYTTGFIFQSYEIKCNYRHFRPYLWLFADVILWCEGEIYGCVSGWVVFGKQGRSLPTA